MFRRYRTLLFTAIVAMILDQASKFWVVRAIPEHRPITVVPGLFDLINIRNRGAAFGILNRPDIEWQFWVFLAATVVATVAIVTIIRQARHNAWLSACLGLVLGGAYGNLIDRLRMKAVIDFLDLYWRDWHWPAFNVADMAICAGAVGACFYLWRNPLTEAEGEKK